MEQKFGKNSIDIEALREFCEREGKEVTYRKGDQLEREGDPARWFGFVTEGCFKYVTYGISDDREHITWFSFEGEFAGDYPACLDGGPAQTTIEAMVPTRIIRVSGEQLMDFFRQDAEKMELRSIIAEHYSVRPAPATSTSTAPQPANAMSCCCSVAPALLSILTYRTSPRSSASPRKLSGKIRKAITFSEHKQIAFYKTL